LRLIIVKSVVSHHFVLSPRAEGSPLLQFYPGSGSRFQPRSHRMVGTQRPVFPAGNPRGIYCLFLPITRRVFRWSTLTIHDGPISVAACFRTEDLAFLPHAASTIGPIVRKRPWFRLSAVLPPIRSSPASEFLDLSFRLRRIAATQGDKPVCPAQEQLIREGEGE
jgi:hypothetical protein